MANVMMELDLGENTILTRLKYIVRQMIDEKHQKIADVEHMTEGTHLRSLPIDSLTFLQLIAEIEEAFEISIPEEKEADFRTVGDLVQCIEESLEMQKPGVNL